VKPGLLEHKVSKPLQGIEFLVWRHPPYVRKAGLLATTKRKTPAAKPVTAFFFCDYWSESLQALLLPPRESASLPLAPALQSEQIRPEPAQRLRNATLALMS